MKLNLSRDGFDLSTDRDDLRLAEALADTLESTLDLADAAGLTPDEATCWDCGDEKRTRPMRVFDDDGRATTEPVCADCQAAMIRQDEGVAEETGADTLEDLTADGTAGGEDD